MVHAMSEGEVDGPLAARGDLVEKLVTPYAALLRHNAFLKGLNLPAAIAGNSRPGSSPPLSAASAALA